MAELKAADAYFTMTQTVIPRPIAWVLSENQDRSLNLAPFSYFNAVASDPPLIMFSIGLQPDGTQKDTLINIEERNHFVVNIASVQQLPDLNQTSATLPYGTSEIETNSIHTAKIDGFTLPRVAQCKLAMCCTTYELKTIGNNNQALVFGEVQSIWIDDSCAEMNEKGRLKISAKNIEPLARLGAGEYATFGDILSATRPE
ncbi:MAG: flavin reductase family protein [Acidiferrobacterales bacterium]|nr:flavin reductase family protein [Acidiferrobacterales bacterium]